MGPRSTGARFARVVFALVVAAVMALALYWGFIRNDPSASAPGSRVELNFNKSPDGPAPTYFDAGQPAMASENPNDPGASFSVKEGRLTYQPSSVGTAAAYFSTPDMGQHITGMGARWVFRPSNGTHGAIALLVSRGVNRAIPQPVTPFPIHLVVTPLNWNLSLKREPADSLEVIAAGNFKQPLLEDGATAYDVRVSIDGGQATLDLPDGTRRLVKDPRISEWQGNYATFELFSNHGLTDSIGAFERVWADSGRDAP